GDETILLVEDQREVRQLACMALRRYGYTVHPAASAAEALTLSRSLPVIDLMLTDVIMPGMNGRELASRLSQERPDLRVVFMSGYTDETIAQLGVLEPGSVFLQKPFVPESLAEKVREILGPRSVCEPGS